MNRLFDSLRIPQILIYTLIYILGLFFHFYFSNILFFTFCICLSFCFITLGAYKEILINSTKCKIILLNLFLFFFGGLRLKLTEYYSTRIYNEIPNNAIEYKAIVYDKINFHFKYFNHELIAKIISPENLRGRFVKLLCLKNNNIIPGNTVAFTTSLVALKKERNLSSSNNFIATGTADESRLSANNAHLSCFENLLSYFLTLRYKTYLSLNKKMSKITGKLYSSLFLGNNNILGPDFFKIRNSWNFLGIAHYLARSGLHIMLLLMIWNYIILLIPCSLFKKHFLLLCIATFYYLLSWPSLSFNRAFLGAIFFILCKFRNIPMHQLHIISLISLLTLFVNPLDLFRLDFQLSFGLTFILATYNQISHSYNLTR